MSVAVLMFLTLNVVVITGCAVGFGYAARQIFDEWRSR